MSQVERAYSQVRAAIERGDYPIDSPLPNQPSLARTLRVSTVTLRQALGQLAEEGFVEARQGAGTFVRSRQFVRGHVLVADDDPAMREMLQSALEGLGYRVELASGGQDAVQRVTQRRFSHALLDIRMSGVDGVQAGERISEISPKTVVVYVTAYPNALLQAGRRGTWPALVLRKPFDLDELENVLELQRA